MCFVGFFMFIRIMESMSVILSGVDYFIDV